MQRGKWARVAERAPVALPAVAHVPGHPKMDNIPTATAFNAAVSAAMALKADPNYIAEQHAKAADAAERMYRAEMSRVEQFFCRDAAQLAQQEESSTVAVMVWRMRLGAHEADFIAAMQDKGYTVTIHNDMQLTVSNE